ncbi:MAG: hypothetical protein JW708_05425 [Vallitaleaceae bacterium]|nr:hypothetical protein [Vallitaleaceae bacterium]
MGYNDVFKEQLVKKKGNSKDLLAKSGLVLAGVVLIFALGFIPVIGELGLYPILFAVIIWLEFIFLRRFNVEFEYVFTNGELDIDKIYNRSKRKHALSVDVKSFTVMVNMKMNNAKGEMGDFSKTLDFSSGEVNENTYAAIFEDNGIKTRLIFEPNETLFDAIRTYIPRKIKK